MVRRVTLGVCLILALGASLWTLPSVQASGIFWLPTQRASDASFDHLNPVLAAYKNHGYILSVRVNGDSPVTSVYFSTNETGKWNTQLMSSAGPSNTYSEEFVSLAVDSSTGRLYAAWVYAENSNTQALGVWTRIPGGQWSGPTNVATEGSLQGQPFIVAANGKAYATFISSDIAGVCDDSNSRSGDVQVVSYDGANWSSPRNLTSCVADSKILEFITPKLALDEQGRAYLVSAANGDLWYADNVSGSWSNPVQMTSGANVPDSVGTSLRTFYGVAASQGTAYVAFVRHAGTPADDVLLTSHASGGAWSTPARVSPSDSFDCPKFGVSIVASSGRVGISYVRGSSGYCHGSSGVSGSVPFLFTGAPGQMSPVRSLVGKASDCFATSLANEGNLFRFAASCDHPATIDKGQLYYKAEFLDTMGPISRLEARNHGSSSIQLRWSARDPQPGSGVASYQLQARMAAGGWKSILRSTTKRTLTYHVVRRGTYTFRVRARDHARNWGNWVSAIVRVTR